MVSIIIMSEPPSIRPNAASVYSSASWSKVMARKPGSFTLGRAITFYWLDLVRPLRNVEYQFRLPLHRLLFEQDAKLQRLTLLPSAAFYSQPEKHLSS